MKDNLLERQAYNLYRLKEAYNTQVKVQAAFARLAKGKTVLMIAHRLSTVASADCIYVVQDGQIVESGTKDELCAQNGLFARMWQEYQASVQWKVAKEG